MKEKKDLNLPADLGYTDAHIWVREQPDGSLVVGVSDFAQDQLGDVLYVDLPEPGSHFEAGDEFGTVESVKSVSSLYAPVGGTIEAVNSGLEDNPGMVNRDCYGDGWMIRIRPDATARLKQADEYRASLA